MACKIESFSVFHFVKWIFLFLFSFLFLYSCKQPSAPLPKGYIRIDLPEKNYTSFDTTYPYSFNYPVYAQILADQKETAEPYWSNLFFPDFKAVVHISYKPVKNQQDLYQYMEDGRNFVNKHIPKATSFQERIYAHPENNVWGTLFEINGKEAASPLQFFLTDSTDHFLRGSLYFNTTPNNDSLNPVIEFLKKDVTVLMETLRWEEKGS